MTALSTTEIDALLSRYREAEARVAANLVELDDHPTYALLVGDVFTGQTATRVAVHVARAPELWRCLGGLRQVLDTAVRLRADGRMNDERRSELTELLTGRSVAIAAGTTRPALTTSGIEGERHEPATIDDTLRKLRDMYEPIRDAVAEIDDLWRHLLPRFDAAETTLRELRSEVERLGTREATISIADRALETARETVMDDPLGLAADIGETIDEAVHAAALQVGEIRTGHETLDADLARAEVLMADARSLRGRAATAAAEARVKVADTTGLVAVPGPGVIDALAKRAGELRGGSDGQWQSVRSQLDGWLETAERLVAQLGEANRRNEEPLARRDQLRGLWRAYKAKAAAVGSIESPAVADLLDDAHNELFTAPADLDHAEALLDRIATAVTAGATR